MPSMATTPWTVSANLAVNRWNTVWNCSGSSRRNSRLKVSWLGKPFSSLRKPRRNGSFATAKAAMWGTLGTTQDGAHGYHQQFMQVMKTGIAGSRILQSFKAGNKLVQLGLR
jgi:hypothetical protein